MHLIDTHTHLYLEEFVADRETVVKRAMENGVSRMLLPNIDSESLGDMLSLHRAFPENCLPMIGLHPTSVKKDFERELNVVEKELETGKYCGIGEIGVDLYWDTTYEEEQLHVFKQQLILAKKYKLPVSIHVRNSFEQALKIVKQELTDDLKGVFHCFTGNVDEAKKIMDTGFKMGIGGILTFKNSGLDKTVKEIPLENIVLETDAPYLTPVPYRGKRNESAYLTYIARKLSEIKDMPFKKTAEITTANAMELFNLKKN